MLGPRGVASTERGLLMDPRGVSTLVLGAMLLRGVRKGVPPIIGLLAVSGGVLRGLSAGLDAVAATRSLSLACCLHRLSK